MLFDEVCTYVQKVVLPAFEYPSLLVPLDLSTRITPYYKLEVILLKAQLTGKPLLLAFEKSRCGEENIMPCH